MPESHSIENEFLRIITEITEANITNEQFGVSELAREVGMSRSNLLRKVKILTSLSVSQFIRNLRLEHAKKMLIEGTFTVSEISFKVGFSSVSYFIKCFRESYGYPPGEVEKHKQNVLSQKYTPEQVYDESESTATEKEMKNRTGVWVYATALVLLIATILFIWIQFYSVEKAIEKSIAVLPFKNDSNDSTNVYLINGLMESVLNDLQKIENLKVISRTSVEKYRTQQKTIPEIARELGVQYLVEGSGQKTGDKIFLNIQLIEAKTDKHLWAGQYVRETADIFKLQREVANSIVEEIEVVISPEEEQRIDKISTKNSVAYDYFLKGLDLLQKRERTGLEKSIGYFRKANQHDNHFARAYAATAMAYYFLDENQNLKQFSDSINYFADKAMLNDPQLPQSLIAKALFYMTIEEYTLAEPYLKKALEYKPNYDLVFVYLLDLYANHLPNTEKYLEYALRGLKIDISAYDSIIASLNYLHISNAFIQTGFTDKALEYIDKSLEYNPSNLYSEYVKAYILFAKNQDLEETKQLLIQTLNKDTTRLDVLQEVAKIHYYQRDFEGAYKYYRKFIKIKNLYNLDIYSSENAKIGLMFSEIGLLDEAKTYFQKFKVEMENDKSVYKHAGLALYYANQGNTAKAIDELKMFAHEDHFSYWTILFLNRDPLMDNLKNNAQFLEIFEDIENTFWNNHKRIKASLKKKRLI